MIQKIWNYVSLIIIGGGWFVGLYLLNPKVCAYEAMILILPGVIMMFVLPSTLIRHDWEWWKEKLSEKQKSTP